MLSLNIKGNLSKLCWDKIPDIMADEILNLCLDTAYVTAYKRAPVLSGDFRDAITKHLNRNDHYGWIVVSGKEIPYNMLVEFGSRHRFAHPTFRPAAAAAKSKMRQVMRKAIKDAATKAKAV